MTRRRKPIQAPGPDATEAEKDRYGQLVAEDLMKPVLPMIALRVKAIMKHCATLIPTRCPHCGHKLEIGRKE